MRTDPTPDDDEASRITIQLAEELLAEHGQHAVATFAELLGWVALHPEQDWQQELEDGIAALRRGHLEVVRGRLAVLEHRPGLES